MKIEREPLDKRWKWLAADYGGIWWFYTHKPIKRKEYDEWEVNQSDRDWEEAIDYKIPFKGDWKDSLHKRNGDEWELVK